MDVTDLFLYDVKAADTHRHKLLTGMNNDLILQNLRLLSETGKQIHVKIPFIVGYNHDQIEEMALILKPLNIGKVEVLPYHALGNSKYTSLGIKNELLGIVGM